MSINLENMRILYSLLLGAACLPALCNDGLLNCNFELNRNLSVLASGRNPQLAKEMHIGNIKPKAPAMRLATDADGMWKPDSVVSPKSWKSVYQYDAQGQYTMLARYSWDDVSDCWKGESKEVMDYDENGNNVLFEWWGWDFSSQQWYGISRYTYEYDADGMLTHSCEYEWLQAYAEWQPAYMHDFGYDHFGNTTLAVAYHWDAESSSWIGTQKVEYAYNELNSPTLFVNYIWDSETAQWIGDYKYTFDYDPYTLLSSFKSYSWIGSEWVVDSYSQGVWNSDMTCWTLSEYIVSDGADSVIDQLLYYFDQTSSAPSPSTMAPQFSLNGRRITLSAPTSVYDIDGRTVAINANGTVDLPASGIYVVKMADKSWKIAVSH